MPTSLANGRRARALRPLYRQLRCLASPTIGSQDVLPSAAKRPRVTASRHRLSRGKRIPRKASSTHERSTTCLLTSADYLTLRVPAAEPMMCASVTDTRSPCPRRRLVMIGDRICIRSARAPDVVQTIVRRFAGDVTDAMCRHAEACPRTGHDRKFVSAMLEVTDVDRPLPGCATFPCGHCPGGHPHDLVRSIDSGSEVETSDPTTPCACGHKYYHTRLQHADETVPTR